MVPTVPQNLVTFHKFSEDSSKKTPSLNQLVEVFKVKRKNIQDQDSKRLLSEDQKNLS